MNDGDKALPPLFCGSLRHQALLHSVPCMLAGISALLAMFDHFRFGLLVFMGVAAWVVWRCPWSARRQLRLPVTLLTGPENQLLLQLGSGEQVAVQLPAQPFLHPRLGVIQLRSGHRKKHTLIGIFPLKDEAWRLWRLYLRQLWDARKGVPDRVG